MNKTIPKSDSVEEKVEELSVEEIQIQRKESFAKRYESTFGNKSAYEARQNKESEEGFALNYYGIKSNWL
ncbi:hypothetical protein ACQKDD_11720 [Planococcus kocurii]|uniref:hypothetical protein n=1 Tax=Planococcus kocurii TaxID=1374 RepID=UPI003D068440